MLTFMYRYASKIKSQGSIFKIMKTRTSKAGIVRERSKVSDGRIWVLCQCRYVTIVGAAEVVTVIVMTHRS